MTTGSVASDTGSLTEVLFTALLAGPLRLPLLPDVAVRVREAVADPGSGALGLAQIVSADAALAARVIKLANSASFAGLVEIRDLPRAIARLGPAMLVALAMGAAGKDMFRSTDQALNELLALSWRRSLLGGSIARRLADDAGFNREESFLCALLHAVGEPVVLDLLLARIQSGDLVRPNANVLADVLATLRPTAGMRLLQHWKLPSEIVDAVGGQGAEQMPGTEPTMAGLLCVTADIARRQLPGPPPVGGFGAPPPWIRLDASKYTEAIAEGIEDYRELAHVL